ncbi:DUF664 domain-containing protein [Carnobacterium sp. ISL-102]|uniref:DinB family protein n=1 Tax=Carnobacterium sp. ISL-102 TaxID=2819142 RepID=UPI002035D652|nr:DUF664 domain-containing protein [Carnobacterium sp. ISL-102]
MTTIQVELLDRVQERFEETLDKMTVEEANKMPHPLLKSVTWLFWHNAREIDMQISDLKGEEALYTRNGWNKRFDLPLPDDTPEYKHTSEEAEQVTVSDKNLLSDYLDVSIKLAKDYLANLNEDTLDKIVDENWSPPVTHQARLISIIDDAVMHSGQAVYTRRLVIDE